MMKNSGRKSRSAMADTEEAMIHGLIVSSAAVTQYLFNLNPSNLGSLFTRLAVLADSYAHFRVKSLKFRLHSNNTASTLAAGFVGGVQDTPPATIGAVMELLPSVYTGGAQQIPSNWVTVPKADLAGPFPWYKSLLGTADATEESPGLIVAVTSVASVPVQIEVYAVYVFKTAVAPANTPVALRLAAEVRAARLLAIQSREAAALRRVLAGAAAVSKDTATGSP